MSSPKFIVFEGIDASGKSSQVKAVGDYLRKLGYKVWETKEPTDSPIGQFIKDILSGKINLNIDSTSQEFSKAMINLFSADRHVHLAEIRNMKDIDFILCDRYTKSTIAYQYRGFMISEDTKNNEYGNNEYSPCDYENDFQYPNLTIWIDVPVDIAIDRMKLRGTAESIFETREILQKVRSIYRILWECDEYKMIEQVDGSLSFDEVTESIIEVLKKSKRVLLEEE